MILISGENLNFCWFFFWILLKFSYIYKFFLNLKIFNVKFLKFLQFLEFCHNPSIFFLFINMFNILTKNLNINKIVTNFYKFY